MNIVDAHVHLWKKQNGIINGKSVYSLSNGKSDVGGQVRQMMPPYMVNGENTVEMLISNMDFACVSGAVVTQEVLDGNQNAYLRSAKRQFPKRLKICSYYSDGLVPETDGFDGIKICACKLADPELTHHESVFSLASSSDLFLAVELEDGDSQVESLRRLARQYPSLRIVIGHFGMVTRPCWEAQIALAKEPNVFVESGGITWLFHKEFYPYPSAVDAIRSAASVCGIEKLMWGSDYPRTMTAITYRMSYDFILNTPLLSDTEKEQFLGGIATDFYRFRSLPVIMPIPDMLD